MTGPEVIGGCVALGLVFVGAFSAGVGAEFRRSTRDLRAERERLEILRRIAEWDDSRDGTPAEWRDIRAGIDAIIAGQPTA